MTIDTRQLNRLKPTLVMAQNKHNFTKSEIKIQYYILANPENVIYHSLTELSEASNVAEATVLRFFRKLGYKGFQDFKLLLAQELTAEVVPENSNSYKEKVKVNMIQALENTHDGIDENELEASILAISHSNDVVIFGIGASGIAALDMQNRLMRIGKNVQVIIDSHFQMMRATTLNPHSVVIAISLTGGTKDIVDSVKIASEKGAKIIALTNYVKSPLTKYAHHILLGSAKEHPLDSGSLVSKIAQLYVIDLICTGLSLSQIERAQMIQQEISENVSEKLY
ncbi:MurR/RpiR family transcriptional regulator [Kurthia sibirica]|uniref:RpiR family transcriptional regulator n=1 Tax=Kurthia sibirica TaxID=202750 RepID=A0A2U3AR70_9BACL|nr:MurR/RpiR family transcriptional regulator [Kurthia sibirica]PWI26996.1 RpiR family transcriptional regulator [Kurthia sibirica]GEK34460.1 RpiR family transcriptional regulator [Kurthia sibirica]